MVFAIESNGSIDTPDHDDLGTLLFKQPMNAQQGRRFISASSGIKSQSAVQDFTGSAPYTGFLLVIAVPSWRY